MRTKSRSHSLDTWLSGLGLGLAVVVAGCSDPVGPLTPTADLNETDAIASAASRAGNGSPTEPPPGWNEPPWDPSAPPGAITSEQLDAVARALDRECHVWNSYRYVVQQLGDVLPFSNIVPAEQRHVERLTALFVKRGLPPPPCERDPEPVSGPHFATLQEACELARLEEQSLLGLYDTLLEQSLPVDAITVFTNVREATGSHHVAAFEACSTP